MSKFKDKVVLITGASSGIGAGLAREFAAQGAHLVLVARRADKLEGLAEEIREIPRQALAVAGDVTKDGDMEEAVRQAIKLFGKLDVVVANAGFGVMGRVDRLSMEDFRRQFETNLFGVLRTVYASLDELKKTGGVVALMGSVSGYISVPRIGPYSMSKFAVRALAETMYLELARDGVAVVHIAPGFVDSEIRQVDNEGKLNSELKDPVPDWLVVPTEKAARQMVRAIYRRKQEAVITGHGKALVFLKRHLPLIVRSVLGRSEKPGKKS